MPDSEAAEGDGQEVRDPGPEPSHAVRLAVRAARLAASISPYRLVIAWCHRVGWPSSLAAELYSPLWISALAVGLFCSRWMNLQALQSWPLRLVPVLILILAAWRIVDMWQVHCITLLDRSARGVVSFERSIVLLALNVVELTIAIGVALSVLGSYTPGRAWFAGFSITVLRDGPAVNTVPTAIVDVVGTATALLLLVATTGVVLGRLPGTRFNEHPSNRA